MSSLIVEVVKIDDILVHPNADRLELVVVKGWQCVVQKDLYKIGDKVIYIPIDSILPAELESILFPPDSKIKLHKSIVKSIKIRKALSQGIIISLSYLPKYEKYKVGDDVKDILGITKFEPSKKSNLQGKERSKKETNPFFYKYTDIENIKNFIDVFTEDDDVIVTEKIHGTSFRAGYLPFVANTWWKKILRFFKLTPQYEFVYGSHNVQLENEFNSKIFHSNVYAECVVKYNLKECLKPHEVIYGEIYGNNIQKNYTYGCKQNERKLAIYDVQKNGKWLDYYDARNFCLELNLPVVYLIYDGKFNYNYFKTKLTGNSVMVPSQSIIEGGVIRSKKEELCYTGRKILKLINDEYLLKDNTDYH
jgi:RNA ligase (TIGR02306 family)